MEIDSNKTLFKGCKLVKVDQQIVSIDTRQDGVLQLIHGRYDLETGSFDRLETTIISDQQGAVYVILAHKLCFDAIGLSVLVIVYTSMTSMEGPGQCHAACVYIPEKRVEKTKIFEEISLPLFAQASIGIDSQVVVLDVHGRFLAYLPAFGSTQHTVQMLALENSFSTISLVQLHGNIAWGPLGALEFPVLLHISTDRHQPIDPQEIEIPATNENLDLWSLSTMMDLFNSAKILQSVREDLNTNSWSHHDAPQANSSFFASIRLVQGRIQLKSFPNLDSMIYHLPAEPITHLISLEQDKPLLFATKTCLVSITSTCLPRFSSALSSPISEFFTVNSLDENELVAILLQNGAIYALDIVDGHQFALTPPKTCMGMIPIELMADIDTDGLLLVNTASESENSNFDWCVDHLLGKWATVPLNDLQRLCSHDRPNDNEMNTGDMDTESVEKNPGKAVVSSMMSGAESLVNALKGRLGVARQNLEEMRQRLEAKERVLQRAMNLMSSLSCASYPGPSSSDPCDPLPFVVDEGLAPIIGVDQTTKQPKSKSSTQKSSLYASYLHVDSVQYASLEDKFVIQLSVTNLQEKNDLVVHNAMVSSAKDELFVQMAQRVSIGPNKTGIISVIVTAQGESKSGAQLEVSILLEATGGEKQEQFVVPITALILNPFAPPSAQSSLPIFPFTTSLLITSQHGIVANTINQILSTRFRELFESYSTQDSSSHPLGTGDSTSMRSQEAGATKIFIASSGPSNPFAAATTPLMIKTQSQGNVICLDIGALDEESLLRCIQFLQSHADPTPVAPFQSIIHPHGSRFTSSKRAETSVQERKFTISENPLSLAFIKRYSAAISALKQEVQLVVVFSQTMEGATSANKHNVLWSWKQKYASAQASSDLSMAAL